METALKAELREKYSGLKMAWRSDTIAGKSRKIFEQYRKAFPARAGEKIHIFLSITAKKEVDTSEFIQYYFASGTRVFVPKMKGSDLIAVEIFPDTVFQLNSWGILEPESDADAGITSFDKVITPLLYCDRLGNRVGYGKGFYDRFFSTLLPDCLRIGVGFFKPEERVLDADPFDVPLHYLVTPECVLSFGFTSNSTK